MGLSRGEGDTLMTNLEMQNLVGMMLVITGLSVFIVLTQILDVIQ